MQNGNFLASLCSWGDWFESYFVRNPPEDMFFRDGAHIWALLQVNLSLGYATR